MILRARAALMHHLSTGYPQRDPLRGGF